MPVMNTWYLDINIMNRGGSMVTFTDQCFIKHSSVIKVIKTRISQYIVLYHGAKVSKVNFYS